MTGRLLDGTTRFSLGGTEIKHFAGVSSFSEYSVVPARAVLKVPDDLPLDRAALLGCAVITGVGAAINCARVKPGSSAVVFGTGGVGLNVVQGAAIAGAEKIIAVDLLASKLDLARRFGATHTINAADDDPVAAVRALTGGRGVDYAFEVIGLPGTMRQAYDCLAKRGMAVVVGVAPMSTEVSVPVMSLVYEERVLTGSVYGSSRPHIDIPKLIGLYRAGRLKLDELLTRTYPFEQINEAYAALERGEVARSVVSFAS
jgi:Zn-dependent alcohol dehydrogenase